MDPADRRRDPYGEFHRALAHPRRRGILAALSRRNTAVAPRDLVEELDVEVSNLSYHFRVLLAVHLVELVETKAVRGAVKHYYRPGPGFTPNLADTVALDQIAELVAKGSEATDGLLEEIIEVLVASGRTIR